MWKKIDVAESVCKVLKKRTEVLSIVNEKWKKELTQ